MCGRYAITVTPEMARAYFGYEDQPNFPPRYNIAPTQPVPVVHRMEGRLRFTLMRWGFLPSWVKDPKDYPLVINIRSETALEKNSFRAAIQRRRALMPADGFYEWQRLGRESRPWLIRRPDRSVFAFAALWETWSSPDGSEIDTVALLNTHANGMISAIHERSPVILPPSDFAAWLDPATAVKDAHALLRPPPEDLLEMVRIGRAVNSVRNDGPEVQAPPEADPPAPAPKPAAKPARKAGAGQGSLF
jgi:putative SOS response-associated peptidase YedK